MSILTFIFSKNWIPSLYVPWRWHLGDETCRSLCRSYVFCHEKYLL